MHYSSFDVNSQLNYGGLLRSRQIHNTLRSVILLNPSILRRQSSKLFFKSCIFLPAIFFVMIKAPILFLLTSLFAPVHLFRGTVMCLFLLESERQHREELVSAEYANLTTIIALFLFQSITRPLKLYPHNIESLIPSIYTNWLQYLVVFAHETRLLKHADHIFSISEYDRYTASIFNSNTSLYPYIFTPNLVSPETNAVLPVIHFKRYYLFCGNLNNPPTLSGFVELLEAFKGLPTEKLIVTGNLSSDIIERCSTLPNIQLTGYIDHSSLHALARSSRAIIIYQTPCSGYATRISEFCSLGCPILINDSYLPAILHGHPRIFPVDMGSLNSLRLTLSNFQPNLQPQ